MMDEGGITRAGEGLDGVAWSILGQTYRPVQRSEASFAFEALFPPGTFLPPHVHLAQDKFVRVLEGALDLMLNGEMLRAEAGDLIRLPGGSVHGLYNRGGAPVRALFWVAPALELYDLFSKLDGMMDPERIVRVSGEHDVLFLPPPPES